MQLSVIDIFVFCFFFFTSGSAVAQGSSWDEIKSIVILKTKPNLKLSLHINLLQVKAYLFNAIRLNSPFFLSSWLMVLSGMSCIYYLLIFPSLPEALNSSEDVERQLKAPFWVAFIQKRSMFFYSWLLKNKQNQNNQPNHFIKSLVFSPEGLGEHRKYWKL